MAVIELVRMMDTVEPPLRRVLLGILEEMERQQRENVTKKEFNELKEVVSQIGRSVAELAEAQRQTEKSIKELTTAQKKTEKEIAKIYQQIGGLSMAVGYGIEDKLMPYMDVYAKKMFDFNVLSVDRTNIQYDDGRYDEINILAKATDKKGQNAYIVAECKAQPGKKDLERFVSLLGRVSAKLGENIVPLLIGYSFTPEVERYAASKYPNIKLVKTYQIQMAERRHS